MVLHALTDAPEILKTVTILFTDLVGSTSLGERLDPESLHAVLTRYFDRMSAVLTSHGGAVRAWVGDAIMAVFGLPRAHEDDALRAVRAARTMRDALSELNVELERDWGLVLQARTGIDTGEVIAADPAAKQVLVSGDAANVAARLEQAAGPGEILIGASTFQLVQGAVEVESVDPVHAKGKAEPVVAFRLILVRADADAIPRRHRSALVGRDVELNALLDAFGESTATASCRLVTVLGDPGVGKSRLVAELVARVGDGARVLRGRCLPYGQSITFRPLAEAFREAAGIADHDPAEEALAKLRTLLEGDQSDASLADPLATAIGLSSGSFALEETFWATRRAFAHLAATRPLVVVFDDLHWAETAFLDLIIDVANRVTAVPLLLVCAARHDLVEDRPDWARDVPDARSLTLERLAGEAVGALVRQVLGAGQAPPRVMETVERSAQGNPLFVEQMLALWIDQGLLAEDRAGWRLADDAASLVVPPSVSAVLSARLDRLPASERGVIERASVVGQVFPVAAVEALSPEADRARTEAGLVSLAGRQLLGRGSVSAAERDEWRFLHALIRDAAYAGILKRTRADLHERYADWLEGSVGQRRAEHEEIIGYHLAQACELLADLGPLGEHGRTLGDRAARALWSAGRSAATRGVPAAGVRDLSRALALTPEGDLARPEVMVDLACALRESGRWPEAHGLLEEARAMFLADGRDGLAWRARVELLDTAAFGTDERERVLAEAYEMVPRLEAEGDHFGLAKTWRLISLGLWARCTSIESERAMRIAAAHACLAGDLREETEILAGTSSVVFDGPTPIPEGIAICEDLIVRFAGNHRSRGFVLLSLSVHLAAADRTAEAQAALDEASATLDEAGVGRWAELRMLGAVSIAQAKGEVASVESALRRFIEDHGPDPETIEALARALYAQGRSAEALAAAESIAPSNEYYEVVLNTSMARSLCALGRWHEAEPLAREALRRADHMDWVEPRANARVAMGEALAGSERAAEAIGFFDAAEALFLNKGHLVGLRSVRAARERALGSEPSS